MEAEERTLTPTEWHLMECLWERSPRTGRETVEYMTAHQGWSRSTTLTMLRRMTEKGLIRCGEEGGMHVYSPAIDREGAVQRETDSFLSRVYRGSVSSLLSAFTQKQKLTREEIDALYAIIRQSEEGEEHG